MKRFASTLATLLLWTGASALYARSAGAPAGVSGAPGDGLCTNCHTSFPAKDGGSNLTISFAGGSTYVPGQTQRIKVTLDDSNARRWGFQVSPRVASSPNTTGAGKLVPVDSFTQLMPDDGTRQWITHTSEGTRPGTAGPTTFEFDWIAPATDVGDITFYVAGNAANNNGTNQGDQIYKTSAVLKAGGGTAPAISANGVVNGASFRPGITAGSWISILGDNLAVNTRIWDSAREIIDGKLPTALDGTSVTINGKPASVYFISPTQLNVQAPDDDSTGPVNVVVTTPSGTSQSTVQMQRFTPALFPFDPQGRKYAAATAADGTFLGPAGLFGSTVTTRPAKPGETIVLYGTGFGPTSPAVASGSVFNGAAPLANQATVTIGGSSAQVAFAGLSGAGLYQFNVVVPTSVADGDQAVVVSVGGQQSADGVFLAVQR